MEDKDNPQWGLLEVRKMGTTWTAVMADGHFLREKLGTSIDAIRSQMATAKRSPGTAAKLHFRGGIHLMTEEQLEQRLPDLEKQGMDGSVAAFSKGLELIHQKQNAAPSAPAPVTHLGMK